MKSLKTTIICIGLGLSLAMSPSFVLPADAAAKETRAAAAKADEIVITFKPGAGEGTMDKATCEQGSKSITLPANEFTRKGYIFTGWAKDPAATVRDFEDNQKITDPKTMTLYALWEPQMYRIRFDGSDATAGEMEDVVASYDQVVKLPQNQFYKQGYKLKGWQLPDGSIVKNLGTVKNLDTGDTKSEKVITVDAGLPKNEDYTFRSTQGSVVYEEDGKQYLVTAAMINDDAYYDGDLSHYETVLTKYDVETGKAIARARNLAFDHGNGICYNPKNKHFYIAEGGSLADYPGGVLEVDSKFKKVKEWEFPLLTNIWGIGHADDTFYVIGKNQGSRNSFCVLNDEMKTLAIMEADEYYSQNFSSQGIATDGHLIYAVSACFKAYNWKSKQRINVFTTSGEYQGVWTLDIPNEAEDITILDDYAYITTNEKSKCTLYKTKLPTVTLKAVWTK